MRRHIVISACHSGMDCTSSDAVQRTAALMRDLSALGTKPKLVMGKYLGKNEMSVMLEGTDLSVNQVRLILRKYSQAVALMVLGTDAYFINQDGSTEMIGTAFQSEFKPAGDYTYVIDSGYYISVMP